MIGKIYWATWHRDFGKLAMDDPGAVIERFRHVDRLSADELASMNDFQIKDHGRFE